MQACIASGALPTKHLPHSALHNVHVKQMRKPLISNRHAWKSNTRMMAHNYALTARNSDVVIVCRATAVNVATIRTLQDGQVGRC